MIVFPPCKINLGLFVTGKRPDGFHSLESLFLPVPLTDVLEVVTDDGDTCVFSSSGLPISGDAEHNIVVKAWRRLRESHGIGGVKVHLHKLIPMGAGLGGGSSDGAFMLRVLNTLFELNLSETELESHAAALGSDCPFFIRNRPQFVTGRGEVMSDAPPQIFTGWLALITPEVHVSTPLAYSLIRPKPAPVDLRMITTIPLERWQDVITNDFEAPVIAAFPMINQARTALKEAGANYVAMSGSGSTVFGLFESKPAIQGAFVCEVNW
ncbi:MAG: 4-(cytidine 5'-diphospho)-2-C-methyl-D-erythritol kinase [Flavobacteriales bacterium]